MAGLILNDKGVVKSNEYFNEAIAAPNGFFGRDVSGENNPFYGKSHSEKSILEMKESLKGRVMSDEHKMKIGKAGLGRTHTKETIEKISSSKMGHEVSPETREKLRLCNLGKTHTEETKAKMSKNSPKIWLGKKLSPEVREKMSKAKKGTIPWNKGKQSRTVECPHCGKVGAVSIMKRWHFENCKEMI